MTNQTLSRRSFSKVVGVSAVFTALQAGNQVKGSWLLPPSAPNVVRLSSNENPYGPSAAALKAMPTPDLKQQWRELFGKEPPPYNRRFLESRLA